MQRGAPSGAALITSPSPAHPREKELGKRLNQGGLGLLTAPPKDKGNAVCLGPSSSTVPHPSQRGLGSDFTQVLPRWEGVTRRRAALRGCPGGAWPVQRDQAQRPQVDGGDVKRGLELRVSPSAATSRLTSRSPARSPKTTSPSHGFEIPSSPCSRYLQPLPRRGQSRFLSFRPP